MPKKGPMKETIELRLALAEFEADVLGKTLNLPHLKIFIAYRKQATGTFRYNELRREVGDYPVRRALRTGVIRKTDSEYELTSFGARIGESYHNILSGILKLENPPKNMSIKSFKKYKRLAEEYNKLLETE